MLKKISDPLRFLRESLHNKTYMHLYSQKNIEGASKTKTFMPYMLKKLSESLRNKTYLGLHVKKSVLSLLNYIPKN
jgi:hypothetical protein